MKVLPLLAVILLLGCASQTQEQAENETVTLQNETECAPGDPVCSLPETVTQTDTYTETITETLTETDTETATETETQIPEPEVEPPYIRVESLDIELIDLWVKSYTDKNKPTSIDGVAYTYIKEDRKAYRYNIGLYTGEIVVKNHHPSEAVSGQCFQYNKTTYYSASGAKDSTTLGEFCFNESIQPLQQATGVFNLTLPTQGYRDICYTFLDSDNSEIKKVCREFEKSTSLFKTTQIPKLVISNYPSLAYFQVLE